MKAEKKTYNSPALGCLLGSANQVLLRELDNALKEANLNITTTEYLVLKALYSKDGIQQCEIADMVGRDKAGICRCVSGLARKELVRTEVVSHKCLRIYLTDLGISIRSRIMKVADMSHKALSDLISPEEMNVFQNVLKKIVNVNNYN